MLKHDARRLKPERRQRHVLENNALSKATSSARRDAHEKGVKAPHATAARGHPRRQVSSARHVKAGHAFARQFSSTGHISVVAPTQAITVILYSND